MPGTKALLLIKQSITDNIAVHAKDGVARLQMKITLAVPGDGCRYLDNRSMNQSRPQNATDEEWGFIQALADSDASVRSNAAGALHALDAECAVPAMIDALKTEPNEMIRGNYVYYLGYLCVHGSKAYDQLLVEAFDEIAKSEPSQNVLDEMDNDDIRAIRDRI